VNPGKQRNHVIDVARALSVIVVVVFHTLLYRIRVVDGEVNLIPWAAPSWLYPLTWVLMIMPLFFVAGGFANALTVDRMHRQGTGLGHYLAGRGHRLVGPLSVFVTFCALVSTAAAWLGWLGPATELSRQLMQLLWFITVYLVIVAAAPVLVRLHDAFGVWPMIALAMVAAAVDAWSFQVGRPEIRNLNMIVVWPLVHQFGIAYQRGWWRAGARWAAPAAIALGTAGVLLLVFVAGYPPTSVGFADIPFANLQPPTLAMASLALAQCGLLALVERSGWLARLSPKAERLIGILNAVMVSVYLWHIPCIAVAGVGLLLLSALAPALAPILLSPPLLAISALAVVAAVVPLLGRLELRMIPPLGPSQDTAGAIMAYGTLVLGTLLVWQYGTVLHPTRVGSSLGVILIWLGSWLMGHAADRTQAAHRTGRNPFRVRDEGDERT